MRGGALTVGVLALVLAAGCGGTRQAASPECVVHVYLELTASRAEVDAVRHRLEKDGRVAKVTYVSTEQALAKIRKKFPELVKNLSYNPLPDAFDVTPTSDDEAAGVASSLDPPPAGVHNVAYFRRRC